MNIYLYVKTHNKTGLKYLGKTISKNPHRYRGSGLYWIKHLKVHGADYTTEIIKECHSKEELKKWVLYYSDLWNVVKSKEWANLKPENGDGGGIKGLIRSEATKEKFRNKVWTEKAIATRLENCLKNSSARKGKKNPNQSSRMKGKKQTVESNIKRSIALKGRKTSSGMLGKKHREESNLKRIESLKKIPNKICPYCSRSIQYASYGRWHGNNCKLKP